MGNINVDEVRTAVGLLLTQGINALILLKVLDWDGEQVAGISLFLGTATTLFFLFVKSNTPSAKGE